MLKDYKESLVKCEPKKENKKDNGLVQEILDDLRTKNNRHPKTVHKHYEERLDKNTEIDKVLSKSILLNPEFEKLHAVPPLEVSEKKLKEQRKVRTYI